QLLYGSPPLGSIASSPIVHIHADKLICLRTVHAPRIFQGMAQGIVAVPESVLNRTRERPRDPRNALGPEIAPDDIAPERQREARLLLPPPPEVDDRVESLGGERELPLVDQEAGLDLTVADSRQDLVKSAERRRYPRRPELESKMRRRVLAGRGD